MDNEKIKLIAGYKDSGYGWEDIAKLAGFPTKEGARSYWRRNKDTDKNNEEKLKFNSDISTNIHNERERVKRQQQIQELKRLTEKRASQEELRDVIKDAVLALDPPHLLPITKEFGPYKDDTALLVLSDVHVGQNTPGRLTGGWNQNVDITEKQFTLLAEKVMQAWDIQQRSVKWEELEILDCGDDVEGSSMRTSQSRIVEPLVIQQTAIYGRMLAQFVTTLLKVFKKIRIKRIPGNHGRVSQRAGVAGLDELDPSNSFDYLAGEIAREILRDSIKEGRVEIVNFDGFRGNTEIAGHKVIFTHGSDMRGGSSYGGIPFYGITRAANELRNLYGDFYMLVSGHFHKPYIFPNGFNGLIVGNGSFPTSTPFVYGDLHSAIPPSQTLKSFNKEHGMTMHKLLYLDIPEMLK